MLAIAPWGFTSTKRVPGCMLFTSSSGAWPRYTSLSVSSPREKWSVTVSFGSIRRCVLVGSTSGKVPMIRIQLLTLAPFSPLLLNATVVSAWLTLTLAIWIREAATMVAIGGWIVAATAVAIAWAVGAICVCTASSVT